MILHSHKLCPAVIPGRKLHIIELVSVHSRRSDGPYFSGYHQIIQSLHCLFDRRILEIFFLSAFPRYSSLVPSEYPFAVSKKLIPRSRACFTISSVPDSSSVQSCSVPGFPKLMQPTQSFDTSMSVFPNFAYSIFTNPFIRSYYDKQSRIKCKTFSNILFHDLLLPFGFHSFQFSVRFFSVFTHIVSRINF